jgi:hypothetical protein
MRMSNQIKLVLVATMVAWAGACETVRPSSIVLNDDRWDDRPNDAVIAAWPLDMRLDVAIERIVELRGRASRGDSSAQARLGPVLDAEEAELWRARQAERERLALLRLAADGVVDDSGAARVGRDALRARLDEAHGWTIGPRRSRHLESLSSLGLLAVRREVARERALALAEMAILRRLIAAAP